MDSETLINNADLYQHIIKIDNTTFKVKKIKKCWYCELNCETFVSICKNCYDDRKKKYLRKVLEKNY